jgi:hypothetical protein
MKWGHPPMAALASAGEAGVGPVLIIPPAAAEGQ